MKLIPSGGSSLPAGRQGTPASASGGKGGVLQHPLQWVVEPLMEQPSYLQRAMFGCLGVYLHGRLMLVLAASREPWQGVLVPTAREHHPALLREEAELVPHPVLAKWLYLPDSSEVFDETAQRLVERVLADDSRIGVEPGQRTRSPVAKRKLRERGGKTQGSGGIATPKLALGRTHDRRGIDSARAPTSNSRRKPKRPK